jgi:hypothetical protein
VLVKRIELQAKVRLGGSVAPARVFSRAGVGQACPAPSRCGLRGAAAAHALWPPLPCALLTSRAPPHTTHAWPPCSLLAASCCPTAARS